MKENIYGILQTVADIHRLMEVLVALQQGERQCCRACVKPVDVPAHTDGFEGNAAADEIDEHYEESELVTIKEAEDYFGRTKLYELRKEGKLITVEHGPREKRLVRAQLEALARWRR